MGGGLSGLLRTLGGGRLCQRELLLSLFLSFWLKEVELVKRIETEINKEARRAKVKSGL